MFSTVFGPIPWTLCRSEHELKGPFFVLSAMMAADFDGPIPWKDSSSAALAVFTFTVEVEPVECEAVW